MRTAPLQSAAAAGSAATATSTAELSAAHESADTHLRTGEVTLEVSTDPTPAPAFASTARPFRRTCEVWSPRQHGRINSHVQAWEYSPIGILAHTQ